MDVQTLQVDIWLISSLGLNMFLGNELLAWLYQRLLQVICFPFASVSPPLPSQYLSLWQVNGWTTLSLSFTPSPCCILAQSGELIPRALDLGVLQLVV